MLQAAKGTSFLSRCLLLSPTKEEGEIKPSVFEAWRRQWEAASEVIESLYGGQQDSQTPRDRSAA